MNNPKLVEAVGTMRRASDSAYRSACDSARSARSACDSAYWSAELNEKAILKIIKEKYEHNTQNKTN